MSLLEDIRKQPRHVREVMFAFSVVITVSLIGVVWFRSFERTVFVMMNPDPEKQQQFFAERGLYEESLFGNIGGSLKSSLSDLKAAMTAAFGGEEAVPSPTPEITNILSEDKVYQLPLP